MRTLTYYGNPILRRMSKEITSEDVADLIEDMKTVLIDEGGLGLAAPQVGENVRVILVDYSKLDDPLFDTIIPFVNPRIVSESKETETLEEGCLSIPGIFEDVKRPREIVVEAQIPGENKIRSIQTRGMTARVFCHEIDHLNGILFIDRISRIRRQLLTKTLREIKRKYGNKV
ncbi:peptide deformylase [bacterium]|nr:peptide deformylase [bacterium]